MATVPTRRRVAYRGIAIDPETELAARLDGAPADLVALLAEIDAEMSVLHRLRIRSAVHFGHLSRSVVAERDRESHLGSALAYIRTAQAMRPLK